MAMETFKTVKVEDKNGNYQLVDITIGLVELLKWAERAADNKTHRAKCGPLYFKRHNRTY